MTERALTPRKLIAEWRRLAALEAGIYGRFADELEAALEAEAAALAPQPSASREEQGPGISAVMAVEAIGRAGSVTRLEIIDDDGRVLTRRPCTVRLSFQDAGRTLKVFVAGGQPPAWAEPIPEPSASTCEMLVATDPIRHCGLPAVLRYPAYGGGHMHLCAEHGKAHISYSEPIPQPSASREEIRREVRDKLSVYASALVEDDGILGGRKNLQQQTVLRQVEDFLVDLVAGQPSASPEARLSLGQAGELVARQSQAEQARRAAIVGTQNAIDLPASPEAREQPELSVKLEAIKDHLARTLGCPLNDVVWLLTVIDTLRQQLAEAERRATTNNTARILAEQERDTLRAEVQRLTEAQDWRPTHTKGETMETTFEADIAAVINRHTRENGSDTPDFILASYLSACLQAFDACSTAREKWYGREAVAVPLPSPPAPSTETKARSARTEQVQGKRES